MNTPFKNVSAWFALALLSSYVICVRGHEVPRPSGNDETRTATRIALNCILAGGRTCDPRIWGGCLIMFPPDHSTLRQAIIKGGRPFEGEAEVRTGAAPTLIYEFTAAPPRNDKTLQIEKDTDLDAVTAKALGFKQISILKGKYTIDSTMGNFGGVIFKLRTQGPIVTPQR